MTDLFGSDPVSVMQDVWLLRSYADPTTIVPLVDAALAISPLRRMLTPRGSAMSVATSNCGEVGWISDRKGYRYVRTDPETGKPWPPMPAVFGKLASQAALLAGFDGFEPDACLINRYLPGTQMGAHQDRDERDFSAPIVSVSLGIPARFYIIGPERTGRSTPMDLTSGDVVVFGGEARRHYHGVRKLKDATDVLLGSQRVNLTFRKAL